MNSRASTRTRLSVLPVFIALLFNLVVPMVSIAVPEAVPSALAPQVAQAVEPQFVSFTLQGCKDPSVNLELTNFVCADADYTTGNLGKSWNELDLVPHRLTTSLGNQADATTTYNVAIVADRQDGAAPGYDVISVPVINTALSDDSCQVTATGGAVGSTVSPGLGGADTSLYRILTITQDKGSTCVFDYYERLALGSHLYPGSSLHSNLANEQLGTSGVGSKEVSIPVKEIEPQELDKTMSATRGQAYGWTIEKTADPASLDFANTCLETEGARSAEVEITIEWTRSGPTATGATLITTNIYATNPAHRTIQVDVTDRIYEGTGQTVLLDTATASDVNVPAGSDELLVLTNTFEYNGSATTFNDVASATYTDLVTGIPVPGQTTATASATTVASGAGTANSSVLITDTESISGAGLTFSVAEPSVGAFTNYAADASTTGPVNWQHTATDSGSVTFTKTVTVDEPRIITDGLLTDTAAVIGDGSMELASDTANVDITASAEVSLTINKTIPAGSLRTGASVTFDFDITGPDGFSDTAQISFTAGGATTGSFTLTGLAPGEYTVSEQDEPGWAPQADKVTSIDLPDCAGSVSFENTELEPDLDLLKDAKADSVSAGDPIGFTITLSNSGDAGTGTAEDVTLDDPLPFGAGIDWQLDSVTGTGGYVVAADTCEITGDPADDAIGQDLDCDFGDLAPGQGVEIAISSETDASSCGEYSNTATVKATNHADLTSTDRTDVLCGDIDVTKTPNDATVNAPGTATFTILTENTGTGEARGSTLFDDLPEVAGGWTLGDFDWDSCAISSDPVDADGDSVLDDVGEWLSCGPETIESLGERTVAVSASVTTDDCGPLANLAEVTTSNDGSDEDEGLITVLCPELGIDKATTTPEVNAGDAVDYTITVENSGDGPANDVVITDDLPEGLTWAETSDDCEILEGTLTCGPMTIAAGASFSVTVTGTTDAGECPSISNTAGFTSSNAGAGSTANTPVEIIVNCPDLEVDKGGSSVVVAGDEVEFTITVTNNGDGDATSVLLTDNLPALGSGTWTITDVVGIGLDDCEIAGNVLTCELDQLASGASFSVTLSATSDPDDCPSLTNDASVSGSNETTDEATQDDNTDSHTIAVNCPDTSIEKEATTPVVTAGDEATFTITVTAGGSGTNEDVTLTDQLAGSALDWSWDVSGDGANEDCSIDAGAFLTCEFGNLEPGATVTVVLTYQTDAGDCPSIANQAMVSATDDVDLDDNASDEVTITVDCPDVTVDKEPVESPISAGEQGQFTIEVSNAGPGTARDVEVTDTAPLGTVWTILDDGGFDCLSEVVGDQQTITCTLDELAAEASATILIGYETTQEDCGGLDNAVNVSASNEPAADTENNSDSATIVVECPGLNMVKTADADPIDAGETASFTITVWNSGPGDAFDVIVHDDLPPNIDWEIDLQDPDGDDSCTFASSSTPGGDTNGSFECEFGTLPVTDMAGGKVILVSAETTREDCGLLENNAWADASNDDRVDDDASILVKCPTITLDKENDAVGTVLPGTTVTYTLTLTVDDGPAEAVMVVDTMPVGLEDPTGISNGGAFDDETRTITWDLGDLADGEYTLSYQAVVADDVEDGEELINAAAATSTNSQCPDLETLGPECEDDSTVIPRVPTLVIDKVADTEVINITGPNDALVATPSVVTWTLTYTLANGPVTNAVITDEVPVGFEFLDASDGGTFADGTVTWTFPTLSESGSVTFRTTVDPETISRVAPTVNVAVIDADETAPDEGEDSVTVSVEPPVLGGTPTPRPSLPDTASGIGINGEPVTVPVELLVALFLGSLGALALANVKARSRRR